MSPAVVPCSRRTALQSLTDGAARMIALPNLFSPCEVLGELLAATRLAFEIVGLDEDETQARAIYEAIADYIDPVGDVAAGAAA